MTRQSSSIGANPLRGETLSPRPEIRTTSQDGSSRTELSSLTLTTLTHDKAPAAIDWTCLLSFFPVSLVSAHCTCISSVDMHFDHPPWSHRIQPSLRQIHIQTHHTRSSSDFLFRHGRQEHDDESISAPFSVRRDSHSGIKPSTDSALTGSSPFERAKPGSGNLHLKLS